MIVYNTTFNAEEAIADEFIVWLKKEYVPKATKSGKLTDPRLTSVLSHDNGNGKNYSLQFRTESIDELDDWYKDCGYELVELLTKQFGNKVAGFSTLLEEMEL